LKLDLPTVHHSSPARVPESRPYYAKDPASWFAYSCIGEESWKISHQVSNLAGREQTNFPDLEIPWALCQETSAHADEVLCCCLAFESPVSSSTVEEYRGNPLSQERQCSHGPL